MTDKYKGVVEMQILGEQRCFKFGTASMIQLCKMLNVTLPELVEKLNNPNDLEARVGFFYTAACQHVDLYQKGTKPTFAEVANWIDHMSVGQQNEIADISFASHKDPNTEAPTTGQ